MKNVTVIYAVEIIKPASNNLLNALLGLNEMVRNTTALHFKSLLMQNNKSLRLNFKILKNFQHPHTHTTRALLSSTKMEESTRNAAPSLKQDC